MESESDDDDYDPDTLFHCNDVIQNTPTNKRRMFQSCSATFCRSAPNDLSYFSLDMETDGGTVQELLENLRQIEPRLFAICQYAFQENEELREQLLKIREEYSEALDKANQLDFELKQARKQLNILLETDLHSPKKLPKQSSIRNAEIASSTTASDSSAVEHLNSHMTRLQEENEQLKKEMNQLLTEKFKYTVQGSTEMEKCRDDLVACNTELRIKSEELFKTILQLQSTMDSLKNLSVDNEQLKIAIEKVEKQRDTALEKARRAKMECSNQVNLVSSLRDRLDECQDRLTTLQEEHIRLMQQTSSKSLPPDNMSSALHLLNESRNSSLRARTSLPGYALSHWSPYADTLDDEELIEDLNDLDDGGASQGMDSEPKYAAQYVSTYSLHALDLADDGRAAAAATTYSLLQAQHSKVNSKSTRSGQKCMSGMAPTAHHTAPPPMREEDDLQDDSSGINCKSLADEMSEISSSGPYKMLTRPTQLQANMRRRNFVLQNPTALSHSTNSSVPATVTNPNTPRFSSQPTTEGVAAKTAFHPQPPGPAIWHNGASYTPGLMDSHAYSHSSHFHEHASSPLIQPYYYRDHSHQKASMEGGDTEENTMSMLSDTPVLPSPSDSFSSFKKFTIVKPMEGSQTLQVWKRLATPSVTSALFEHTPQSVQSRIMLLNSNASDSAGPASPNDGRCSSPIHIPTTTSQNISTSSSNDVYYFDTTSSGIPSRKSSADKSIPTEPSSAFSSSSWKQEIVSSFLSFATNNAWSLLPSRPTLSNVIASSQPSVVSHNSSLGFNNLYHRNSDSSKRALSEESMDKMGVRQRCVENGSACLEEDECETPIQL